MPCKELAEQLGLKIHERPSFEDWTVSLTHKSIRYMHLMIRVAAYRYQLGCCRIIRALCAPKDPVVRQVWRLEYSSFSASSVSQKKKIYIKFSPAFLLFRLGIYTKRRKKTSLRGPAPIHRAFLRGDPFTGISLQTLSPKSFDRGTILAQTPAPGIPLDQTQPFPALKRDLAARGATMLVEGLRAGLHVPPHDDAGWWAAAHAQDGDNNNHEAALEYAPKTSKADLEVDWKAWTADDLMRHMNVFNTVWTRAVVQGAGKRAGAVRRVLFTRARVASAEEAAGFKREQLAVFVNSSDRRYEMLVKLDGATDNCYFPLADGTWICVSNAKMEGTNGRGAMSALRKIFRAPDQPF